MSLMTLAERAGVNQANVSRLETGQAPRSTMASLTRIAEVLGVDPLLLYKAAGITEPQAGLPSFQPYLRAKYGHLPKDKLEELNRFFETIEAEQEQKRAAAPKRSPKAAR
jgi:transcriptional regulator with XRE-family HTH domain